jgi:8-oxo-dGTP pyrophosphatase MutT (NUDIX family)
MLKHGTASVFLFVSREGGWRIGLIHHPRLHRWMLPGGHVEPYENPAETALREVSEETGIAASLINTHAGGLTDASPGIPMPIWIAEQEVPAESRHPQPHIHVDHLYVATATEAAPAHPAELRFNWFAPEALGELDMFPESQRGAQLLFDRIDQLITASATSTPTVHEALASHPPEDGRPLRPGQC